MIKYKSGRVYDTQKAKRIATAGDITLYQKRTREFFLADKVAIAPLTYGLAKEWVAENLSPEIYRELFQPTAEFGLKVGLNLTVKPTTKEKLQIMSAKKDRPIGALIDEWIESVR